MITINDKRAVPLLATVSCLLWGSAFPVLKISNKLLGLVDQPVTAQILFAGYRFFLAGILTLIFAKIIGLNLKIHPKDWPMLIKIGFIQTTIQYLLFYFGLFNTTGINGSIIVATGTFFAIILAHFHYRDDSLSWKKWVGLIIGFSGVLLANLKGDLAFSFNWLGDGLIMASSFLGAYSLILAKESSRKLDPILVSGYQMTLGSIILILTGGSLVGYDTIQFTWISGALLVYLAFLSAAAFAIWYVLLKHHPVSQLSINKFQIPVWGVLLSAVFLPDESLRPVLLLALAAVIAGIFIVHGDEGIKKELPRN